MEIYNEKVIDGLIFLIIYSIHRFLYLIKFSMFIFLRTFTGSYFIQDLTRRFVSSEKHQTSSIPFHIPVKALFSPNSKQLAFHMTMVSASKYFPIILYILHFHLFILSYVLDAFQFYLKYISVSSFHQLSFD